MPTPSTSKTVMVLAVSLRYSLQYKNSVYVVHKCRGGGLGECVRNSSHVIMRPMEHVLPCRYNAKQVDSHHIRQRAFLVDPLDPIVQYIWDHPLCLVDNSNEDSILWSNRNIYEAVPKSDRFQIHACMREKHRMYRREWVSECVRWLRHYWLDSPPF